MMSITDKVWTFPECELGGEGAPNIQMDAKKSDQGSGCSVTNK